MNQTVQIFLCINDTPVCKWEFKENIVTKRLTTQMSEEPNSFGQIYADYNSTTKKHLAEVFRVK